MVQADCGNHGKGWLPWSGHDSDCDSSTKVNLKVVVKFTIAITISVTITFSIAFTAKTLLQPQCPQFVLLNLAVGQFELAGQPDNYQASVTVQPTISSLNINRAVGIHYERFAFSVAYKDQQLTAAGEAPPLYQGHKSVRVIRSKSFLAGYQVPVAPHLFGDLAEDDKAGNIVLTVKLDAQIRWNFGLWTSRRHHLAVSCPAALSLGNVGGGRTSAVEFQQTSACSVSL